MMLRLSLGLILAALVLTGFAETTSTQTSNKELQQKVKHLQEQLKNLQNMESFVRIQLDAAKRQQREWQHQYVKLEVAGKLDIQVMTLTSFPPQNVRTWRVVSRNTLWVLDFAHDQEIVARLKQLSNGERILVKGEMTFLRPAQHGEIPGRPMPVNPVSFTPSNASKLGMKHSSPQFEFVGTLKVDSLTVEEQPKQNDQMPPPLSNRVIPPPQPRSVPPTPGGVPTVPPPVSSRD